jgi:hypothetical protein
MLVASNDCEPPLPRGSAKQEVRQCLVFGHIHVGLVLANTLHHPCISFAVFGFQQAREFGVGLLRYVQSSLRTFVADNDGQTDCVAMTCN